MNKSSSLRIKGSVGINQFLRSYPNISERFSKNDPFKNGF